MHIAVIGAGAIGGTLAALLNRVGHTVEVTARGENLQAIQRDGIQLTGAWGDHRAQVRPVERLMSPPELALVCTKAQDAQAAILANARQLAGIPVVIVQNGLDGLDNARRILPDSQCVGAIAVFAADRPAPGHVTVATPGPLYLGDEPTGPSAAAVETARILRSAIPSKPVNNFVGHQWTKLIVNQANSMPAITGQTVQETLGHKDLRRITAASIREATRIGLLHGVHFGRINVLDHPTLRFLASAPVGATAVLLTFLRRRLGTAPVTGSTLQSIRQGHATEIDHLNGIIVSRAQTIGRIAPVNALLTALVHEVEQTGHFFSPAEITERVGLPARRGDA